MPGSACGVNDSSSAKRGLSPVPRRLLLRTVFGVSQHKFEKTPRDMLSQEVTSRTGYTWLLSRAYKSENLEAMKAGGPQRAHARAGVSPGRVH